MQARTMVGGLVAALWLAAPLAHAQQAAGHAPPEAPPALHAAGDDGDAWGDELVAFLGDDLAWAADDDGPAPPAGGPGMGGGMGMGAGPGAGMHAGMGMGAGAGMHGAMGMGMHGGMGPGMGAMHGMRGGPGMRRGGGARVLAQLDLTPAQHEKLADLHERQMRADIQVRADIATGMLDLHKLMRADRPDKAAIDRQVDRLAALRATRQKAHIGTMLEARTVLTPEQQKKARELHMRGGMGAGPRGHLPDDSRDLETPKR